MSYLELKELSRAEDIFNGGRFDEAYEMLTIYEKKLGINLHEKVSIHLLMIDFLYQQGLYKQVVKIANKTYIMSLELGRNLFSIDALMWMALAYAYLGNLDKANETINEGEQQLKEAPITNQKNYKQREATISFVKGTLYSFKGEVDQSLKFYEHSLVLREEVGHVHDLSQSLSYLSFSLLKHKGELDLAWKYAERGLALAKECKKKGHIAYSLIILGSVFAYRGDLDNCILNFEKSLSIYEELQNQRMIAVILNNIGDKYKMRGELDRALDCLEKSLSILQKLGNLRDIANTHDFLIQILIDKGDIEQARIYLKDMELLKHQIGNEGINLAYLLDKALLLKTSLKARNRVEAEDIFNQLLDNRDTDFELRVRALINLCELHLIELRIINDIEVLDEIKPLIIRLLDIAKKEHSYWILCEAYLLQAKLSLLTFDMKKAQKFLIQAQKIAETYGLKRLAMRISYEHDDLIKKINTWKNAKDSQISLSERLELSGMNKQMESMVKRRIIEFPELSDEKPLLLLIMSEGGTPFFSHSFVEDKSFESHLFGGFLTTIDYFIREMFSEGLDRAVFGEHTLLMKSLSPFFLTYIFKGDSYYAQIKVTNLVESIIDDKIIWKKLIRYFQANQKIEFNDIPALAALITKVFMTGSAKTSVLEV
jgi:tetratricopeptide (TPR) repeat protein